MGDEVIGDRCTTGHHGTDARGLPGDVSPRDAARQFAREIEPSRAQQERWLKPSAVKPPDIHLQFFQDLLALSSSSAAAPLSAAQAKGIRERWGMEAPYVIDPEARQAALLGFELILTVASFVPPVAGFARGVLLVMAIVRGESGPSLAASAVPLGRIKQAERAIRALMKLGRVFKPTNIREYQQVAGQLLTRDKNLAQGVMAHIKDVTSAREKQAVQAAITAYNKEKNATGNLQRAAQAAGNAFHKTMRAAGPGEGADRVAKATKELWEFKTHYVPMVDELVLRGGQKQVIGYVLKELAERSLWYKGRVLHVFIDPVTNQARRLVIDPVQEEKLIEALLRLAKK